MSGSIYDWSQTAADNDDADGDIVWSDSMNPKQVDNSGRQMMGRVAELLADLGVGATSGGSANAQTVTANSAFTAYATGRLVAFKAGYTNTGATTLNVNGIGAKAIRKDGDVALTGGEIKEDGVYVVRYDAAANSSAGAWMLQNPTLSASNIPGFSYTPSSSTDDGYPTGLSYADVASIDGMEGQTAITAKLSTIRSMQISADFGSDTTGPNLYVRNGHTNNTDWWSAWAKLWSDANDGSGSGLDADLLDGNHASAFAVSARGMPSGGSAGQVLTKDSGTNYDASWKTPAAGAGTLTAGNGLTGGGAMTGNVTVTMGTPSSITTSSTNSVTSTSHTHALGFDPVTVYTGSSAGETNYPVGHTILKTIYDSVTAGTLPAMNATVSTGYTGTWRCRGSFEVQHPGKDVSGEDAMLYLGVALVQRTA